MFEPNVVIWPFFETETVKDRRRFTGKCFLEFLGCILFGLLQWVLVVTALKSWFEQVSRNHSSALFLGFVVGLFLFLIYALSKSIRRMKCMKWLLPVVIVEFLVVGLIPLMIEPPVLYMLIAFLITCVVFLFIVILAATMPADITMGGLYIYLMTLGFYLMSLYCIVLYCILGVFWCFYVFAITMACVVAFFLMYHVQCIMGGRSAATKLYDDKYAALLLFLEFIAFFCITLYIRPKNAPPT